MMPPNTHVPYGYVPAPEPPRQWPVPAARHVPLIWTISLVVMTVIAVSLVALAPAVTTPAPSPSGTTVYASSLARADGAWNFSSDTSGQCSYINGGLDATASAYIATEVDTTSPIYHYDPTPLCTLQKQDTADLRLSVRILPQANLNATLQPVIFVHTNVALLFTNTGDFAVLYHDTTVGQWGLLYQQPTNQWHTADMLSNTVVVQVRGATYTIALNGAQIYQGDFSGNANDFTTSGAVAVGAYTTSASNSGEAAFADLSLTTP